MIKAIVSLFSSSMIGRLIGLFRFQLMLYLFSHSKFTDDIIYTTTLIWTINNFFITPIVNKSLISDLNTSPQESHTALLRGTILSVLKMTMFVSTILFLGINIIQYYSSIIDYNNYEIVCVILIIISLGINEIFSLYNQFSNKYFVYAFNRTIWNIIIMVGLIIIAIANTESLLYYLLFMLISIFISISYQLNYSNINIKNILNLSTKYYKKRNFDINNFWYNGTILIYFGITFIDLNILKNNSVVGIITTYTILLKLPELILSLINGSIQPVFFNSIIKDYHSLIPNMLKYKSIAFLLYFLLFLFTYLFGDIFFNLMFNFSIYGYELLSYYAILMMFLNVLSYMYLRLSVEFEYSKSLFYVSFILLLVKLSIIFGDTSIRIVLFTNIFFYMFIYIISNYFIMKHKSSNYA